MKRRILISLFVLAPFFFATGANSADGPYVSVNAGVAVLSDSDVTDSTAPGIDLELSYDPGWAIGAAVGYRFSNFRVEGEVAYQENDIDESSAFGISIDSSGDVNGTAFLVNGYYDFINTSAFTPFITAGLGYANVEINDYGIPGSGLGRYSDDDSVFAYQVGVGVGYAVNENVTIDAWYRYFATEDPEFDTAEVEVSSHNFLVGARFSF
ncbi:MAG: outer membrane protein [Desulfobulbaceae bacterium]